MIKRTNFQRIGLLALATIALLFIAEMQASGQKNDYKPGEKIENLAQPKIGAGSDVIRQDIPGYPVTEFLEMTLFREVEAAPDGTRVAFITAKDNLARNLTDVAVWTVDIDGSGRKTRETRLTKLPGDYSALRWSPDGRFLAFLLTRTGIEAQLIVVDTRSGKLIPITDPNKYPNRILGYEWMPDTGDIAFALYDIPKPKERKPPFLEVLPFEEEVPDHTSFYRLRAGDFGRREAQVFAATNFVRDMAFSPDGKTIAYISGRNIFLLPTSGKQPPRKLTNNPPLPCIDKGMKWTARGLLLRACGVFKSGQRVINQKRLYRFSLADGRMEQLATEFGGEVQGFSEAADGSLLLNGLISTRTVIDQVDADTGKAKELTSYRGIVGPVSLSRNGKLVAFSLTSEKHFAELYVARGIDQLDKAFRVTDLNARLNQMPIPVTESVHWDNKEGDTIEGALFWPPGKQGAKNLPFVVSIHGGPFTARTEALTTQFPSGYYPALLASRGYLVLDPNYRGSVGRGDDFVQSLLDHACSRPATDILTGVDHVVARGWADPERLGIMGASGGGMVTNCALGYSTRFKAAASTSGGNWDTISSWGESRGSSWRSKPPWEDLNGYWEESAMSRAAKIKTPTLLITTEKDTVVDPSQVTAMYWALVRRGVPAELVVIPDEVHFFNKPSSKWLKLETEL
ncbi:MAG: prolyl oligopeptidase family serine peptidase, partial [Pyrinomonadaceae bacterium]